MASAVDVPMIQVGGLPIIEVMINGQGPFRLGIETGAGFSLVTPETVAALKLARTGGTDTSPEYRLDRIGIGGATFEQVEVASGRLAQAGVAGILGLPFYSELLLTVDYAAQRVRFERGALPPTDHQDILPIRRVGPFWSLPMRVGDAEMSAVIDTRSTGGLSFTPESAKRVTFTSDLQVVGRARGAAIPESEVLGGTLVNDVEIGRYRFPAASATVRALPAGFPTNPIVGTRILSQFVVTLDQKNARIRLARTGSAVINLPAPTPAGAPAAPTPTSGAPARVGGPPVPVADYVGVYGDRVITATGGALLLERGGRGRIVMVPVGPDVFGLEGIPEARIEFTRDAGTVTAIRVRQRDGTWETSPKEKR